MRSFRISIVVALASSACAPTEFVGEAQFGTVSECVDQCASVGRELAAFSYLGEYSTTCSCRPVGTEEVAHVGAAQAAVIGVYLEMQARQQQQAAAAHGMAP